MKERRRKSGISVVTFMYLLLSLVYIAVGFANVLVEGFQPKYVVIIAGFLLLIIGILLIVQYFVSGGFKDLGKYGFSVGVLCVLGGAIVLIKCTDISSVLGTFLGICILLTAVIKLQNAVDMKSLEHGGWLIFLIIAAAFLITSILIILNPSGVFAKHMEWIFYIMIVDGLLNLFSTVYLALLIRADAKRTTTMITKPVEEAVPVARREKPAERISEDDVEVIVPNSDMGNQETVNQKTEQKEEKSGFWKRIRPGIQDKNS